MSYVTYDCGGPSLWTRPIRRLQNVPVMDYHLCERCKPLVLCTLHYNTWSARSHLGNSLQLRGDFNMCFTNNVDCQFLTQDICPSTIKAILSKVILMYNLGLASLHSTWGVPHPWNTGAPQYFQGSIALWLHSYQSVNITNAASHWTAQMSCRLLLDSTDESWPFIGQPRSGVALISTDRVVASHWTAQIRRGLDQHRSSCGLPLVSTDQAWPWSAEIELWPPIGQHRSGVAFVSTDRVVASHWTAQMSRDLPLVSTDTSHWTAQIRRGLRLVNKDQMRLPIGQLYHMTWHKLKRNLTVPASFRLKTFPGKFKPASWNRCINLSSHLHGQEKCFPCFFFCLVSSGSKCPESGGIQMTLHERHLIVVMAVCGFH